MDLDPRAMDALALAWLALCWLGYPRLSALLGRRRASIDARMLAVRRVWMDGLLRRDFRVPDTMLLGQVIQSVVFFASGTIVVVGALARADGVAAVSGGIALGAPAPAASVRLALFVLHAGIERCTFISGIVAMAQEALPGTGRHLAKAFL